MAEKIGFDWRWNNYKTFSDERLKRHLEVATSLDKGVWNNHHHYKLAVKAELERRGVV